MAATMSFDGIDLHHDKDLTNEELERFLTNVLGKSASVGQPKINPANSTTITPLPVAEQLLQGKR